MCALCNRQYPHPPQENGNSGRGSQKPKFLMYESGMCEVHGGAGSRDGAVVRALVSQQCGPGSIPARCHMWVEFVVGSHLCSDGFFPGSLVFLHPEKPIF